MRRRSAAIRHDFAMHRGAVGDHREKLVANFLKEHLPKRFGVRRGFAISLDEVFSNQADILIVDDQNNAPLYPGDSHELWPVESVYAIIEVKSRLSPRDLEDAVEKCRRFKQLKRNFLGAGSQKIYESLFVIWSFQGAKPKTIRGNLVEAIRPVPPFERPDLVVDLNGFVASCGAYLELSVLGQPNSPYRQELVRKHGADFSDLLPDYMRAYDAGPNALLAWYVRFDAWLRNAGTRHADPLAYEPPRKHVKIL